MRRRAFLWILVGISFLVGASAAPAQDSSEDCGTDSYAHFLNIATTLAQAYQDAAGGNSAIFLHDSISLNDAFSLNLGVRADAIKTADHPSPALRFAAFYIGTEATGVDGSSRLTFELPVPGVTATASGSSNLRTGPDTAYPVFGRTQRGDAFNVLAAISRGGFDWLNVDTPNGAAWLRSDQARISDGAVLAGLRPQFSFNFNDLLGYSDSERTVGCPLPSAIVVQTPPNTPITYDFNGLTLLQTGTAVITPENFAAAAGYTGDGRRRVYFTNVQGTLETIAPLAPFQLADADRTFAVEFNENGTPQGYTGSFTPAEQEMATSAWRFACNTANLYNWAVFNADGEGFLYADAPCTGTFTDLQPGWNTMLDGVTAILSAPVTDTAAVAAEVEMTPEPAVVVVAPVSPAAPVPPVEPMVVTDDSDADPVDCNTLQSATGSVVFWNLKSLSAEPVAGGVRLTATLEGGENIPGGRYVYFRVKVGDEAQKLYALNLEGETVVGAGERTQAFDLIPGTESAMEINSPNQVSLLVSAPEFRVFTVSGVVGSACDKSPDTSFDDDSANWLLVSVGDQQGEAG